MISDLETQGGAAIAASRLAEGISSEGVRVTRLVSCPSGNLPKKWETVPLRPRLDKATGLRRRLLLKQENRPRFPALAARTDIRTAIEWIKNNSPDIISLHNIHYSDWTAVLVEQLAAFSPIVWTLHDMWSFTGRCAQSLNCDKFIRGCDASCPTPHEYPRLHPAKIAAAWEQKRQLLSGDWPLVGVCPSHWLAEQAMLGLWQGRHIEVIQHGIDLNQYPLRDKRDARRALGLSADKPILAAVLDQSAEGRKGEPILETVLSSLDISCVVATFGRGHLDVVNPSVELHNFDFLQQPEEVSRLLSAADLFVFPSLAESFGQVVIEAMACGTPTLCYSIGGLPELIKPNVTGWLVLQPTANALTQNLSRILRSRSYLDMPKSCRRHAEHHFSRDRMVSAYLTLFEDVLNEREHTTSTFSPTI